MKLGDQCGAATLCPAILRPACVLVTLCLSDWSVATWATTEAAFGLCVAPIATCPVCDRSFQSARLCDSALGCPVHCRKCICDCTSAFLALGVQHCTLLGPYLRFCASGRLIAGSLTTSVRGGQCGLEIHSQKAKSKDFIWDVRQATVPRAETQGS